MNWSYPYCNLITLSHWYLFQEITLNNNLNNAVIERDPIRKNSLVDHVEILPCHVENIKLLPIDLSHHKLSSTPLSDGEPQELGHTSDSFVKQLSQSNAVQMLGSSMEQEIQMRRTPHFTSWNYDFGCMYIEHLKGLKMDEAAKVFL